MRRLYRSRDDKIVGGVCGGLGHYLDIDPLIVRILFIILILSDGIGLALYILLWIFMPLEAKTPKTANEYDSELVDPFEETEDKEGQTQDRMILVGALLISLGLFALLRNLFPMAWIGKLWPLGLIALGVLVLVNNLKESK